MADADVFINQIRTQVVAQPQFTTDFTTELIYRQYLPTVKEPKFPCITLVYEEESEEIFAPLSNGMLYVGIHMKDFNKVGTAIHWIGQCLHNYVMSTTGVLTIFQCHKKGTPPSPIWDESKQTWEASLAFEVRFG
ncbi:MAG: hypothetical protein WC554_08685 [Clostridia bacterium]|jgi:hypothetical protein